MSVLNIPNVARFLSIVTLAAMMALAIFVAYTFVDTSLAQAMIERHAPDLAQPTEPVTLRIMMAVGLIAIAIQLYVLNAARALFNLYSSGIYLSEENGRAITQIGSGLIALPLARFVLEPIWSILLSLGTDDIDVSISISSSGIGLVLGGLLMLMIGQSMFEATRVRQENEAFV